MDLRPQPKLTATITVKKPISRRQMQVLSLMAEGNLYTDVARLLKLSPLTVRTHVKKAYRKLNVHSKIEALNKVEWLSAPPSAAPTRIANQ